MEIFTIAMDGPVGAGKSSVATKVAKKLGIMQLDTGAMYRAFAWYALKQGISAADEQALTALTEKILPEVRYENGIQHTLIDGQDVTDLIRSQEIGQAASAISKFAGVRKAMVGAQRALAKKQSVLMDGRDIGTVVLKDATLKIYLTAAPEVRAQRRFDQLKANDKDHIYDNLTYEEVLAEVIRRDEQDMNREVDPLRPADDAQILDSSELTEKQVIDEIVRRLQVRMGKKPAYAEDVCWVYRFARWALSVVFHTLFPVKYHNIECAQMDAPYILIANHSHFTDPMLLAIPIYRYQLRIMGKKELMKNKLFAWFANKINAIPVDRHNMDMGAVRTCLKVLKEGHALCMFPEGTRHKEGVMEDIESGASMIALRSGARLLPAYISEKPRFLHTTHVYFHEPVSVKDIAAGGINKDACEAVSQRITGIYREMVAAHEKSIKNNGSKLR